MICFLNIEADLAGSINGRRTWHAIVSALFLSALSSCVYSVSAAADPLQDYSNQCNVAIGAAAAVPDFDCDAGTEVLGQGTVFSANQPGVTCDKPNRLNQQCDPGSRFQVLVNSADAYVVAHCRKEGGDPGMYGDIAVIQYNRKNGATCFYQALGDQSHGNMPGGHTAPNAGPKPVKSPSNGAAPNTLWLSPASTASIQCGSCHDNGQLIRSPYLNQVTGLNALPGSTDFSFNSSQPYGFVGTDFQNWEAFSVQVAGNECNDCHRMGVNNVRQGRGTALDFGVRATAASETSKNPPSANSPIWMPPVPVQTAFNQTHANSSKAIHDCAAQFQAGSPLPNTNACRIALFAQAFPGAMAAGDTHITTFDGLHYDFQAAGEFVLVENGPDFQVQNRQASGAPNWPNADVNKAIAVRMGKSRVEVYIEPTRLVVDGAEKSLEDGKSIQLPTGVRIKRRDNDYVISDDVGNRVQTTLNKTWINVAVTLGHASTVSAGGLLGNPRGNARELIAANKSVLKEPVAFNDLYHKYGDSWRVAANASLFSVKSNIKIEAALAPFRPEDLDEATRATATMKCTAAGVTHKDLLEDCIIDNAMLNDEAASRIFVDHPAPVHVIKPVFKKEQLR